MKNKKMLGYALGFFWGLSCFADFFSEQFDHKILAEFDHAMSVQQKEDKLRLPYLDLEIWMRQRLLDQKNKPSFNEFVSKEEEFKKAYYEFLRHNSNRHPFDLKNYPVTHGNLPLFVLFNKQGKININPHEEQNLKEALQYLQEEKERWSKLIKRDYSYDRNYALWLYFSQNKEEIIELCSKNWKESSYTCAREYDRKITSLYSKLDDSARIEISAKELGKAFSEKNPNGCIYRSNASSQKIQNTEAYCYLLNKNKNQQIDEEFKKIIDSI